MKTETPVSGSNGGRTPEQTAVRVSNISILANVLLSVFKLAAGFLAHSGAMISDAIHSASDVLSSIIVIIGIRLAARDSDAEHPYGHERFECAAAIVLAVILCITGLFIGHNAIEKLSSGAAAELRQPGVLALIAAIFSIAVKEAMYWYTRSYARRLGSGALMADAWHHRSDALSSIGALVGIAGARLGFPRLDAIASLLICGFIVKAACDIFLDAMEKMVDHACSAEMQKALTDCAVSQPGVLGVSRLQTRQFGSKIYVDLEILADGDLTLRQSSRIADRVHAAVETKFPTVKHITVRVNPAPEAPESIPD
ncbi:MAG: cation diffusion facilitator family transporter [Clostridia bacterium]|nr:cation diffusion facilitator family transporter [Clostridia bacterium]